MGLQANTWYEGVS